LTEQNDLLLAQEAKIAELAHILATKAAGGGGNSEETLTLLRRDFTEYSNDQVTELGEYALAGCRSLVSLNLPSLTMSGRYCIAYCSALTSLCLPSLTTLEYAALRDCTSLEKLDLHVATFLNTHCLYQCAALSTLIIRTNSVCRLIGSGSLSGSPIYSGTGYIYVPAALVDKYKTATNWSTFANQFRAIEDYPDICG
jgi:hypothetical protein